MNTRALLPLAQAIQGYEPLLPEAMAYSEAILEAGMRFGIPTTLVTNGVYLDQALDRLIALKLNTIAISLDSDIAEIHDHIRGVPGAWEMIVNGLGKAVKRIARKPTLVVTSVLLPSKIDNLLGMPEFLTNIGIKQWMVNPMLQIGPRRGVRTFERDVEILRACHRLQREAKKHGLHVTCDDEFGCINQAGVAKIYPELAEVSVDRIDDDIELFRLTPSGQCSVDSDGLAPITPDVPQWQPNAVHAADFLASCLARRT
jgi:MoaA/NifB/PqqE/SkfB family radical SAM enzyme